MGNYRFKLSDMIPNAWFYKLRDMGRGRKQTTTTPSKKKKQPSSASTTHHSSKPNQPHHHHHQCNPRKSYYFTRDLTPNNNNKLYSSPSNNPKTPHTNNNSPEPPPPPPPRKPSKQRTTRKRRTPRRTCSSSSSPKPVSCSCRTTLESVWTKSDSPPQHSSSLSPFDDNSSTESEFPDPEFRTDRVLIPTESFDEMVSLSTSCACKATPNTTTKDIVIDVDKNSLARKDDKLEGYHEYDDTFSEVELPPIITKPPKFNYPKKKEHKPIKEGSLKIRILKEQQQQQQAQQQRSGSLRRFSSHSASSPGVKLRVNSPKIAAAGRKVHQYSHGRKSVSSTAAGSRRSLSDSFAIVKSSFNPQKDFRESMVEMIVENNIRASKDLEDLLACYLSLNSDQYHDLIIKVFKQIWFDLTETR